MNKCEKCGFLHYRTDPCRAPKLTPPKPKRKRAKDKRKGDRHAPGYMAEYLRSYRAKKRSKASKPIQ